MTIQTNFPAARPALLLDFANNKRLDPRITFTRTTTATYYDGVTTAKAEENLLLQSQQFDVTAAWTIVNATITGNTSDTTAPDGTSTAEKITDDAVFGAHRVFQAYPYTAGTNYAYSLYVKAGTSNFPYVSLTGVSVNHYITAIFDLSAGTVSQTSVGSTSGTIVSTSITSVGNSWYRITIIGSINLSGTGLTSFGFAQAASGNTIVESGRPANYASTGLTFYAWGAQLEQRSAVTAYTPTTTQAITNYIPVLLSAGSGVARFDHNPITRESLGLLVEEARTNLVTYSDDFTNAAYETINGSITSNTIIAPNGTLTGDKIIANTTNGTHLVRQIITFSATTTYTATTYVKASEQTFLRLGCFVSGVGDAYLYVDLSNGSTTTTNNNWTVGPTSATSVGNNWYRCSITFTTGGTGGVGYIVIGGTTSSGTAIYTGDGYSGIYIWGAQLEAGSLTSYIPTVASTVTRNADTCSIQNISPFFNVSEGTLYFKVSAIPQSSSAVATYPAIGFTPAALDSSRTIQVFYYQPNWYYLVRSSAGDQVYIQYTNAGTATAAIAIAYKTNDFGASLNGATAQSQNTGILPLGNELTALCIGSFNVAGRINGTIRKIAYYRKRLTNAQLQALTT